jgi:hypothetical protein
VREDLDVIHGMLSGSGLHALSCASRPGRLHTLPRQSSLQKYALQQRQNHPFPDDKQPLSGKYPIQRDTKGRLSLIKNNSRGSRVTKPNLAGHFRDELVEVRHGFVYINDMGPITLLYLVLSRFLRSRSDGIEVRSLLEISAKVSVFQEKSRM